MNKIPFQKEIFDNEYKVTTYMYIMGHASSYFYTKNILGLRNVTNYNN